VFSDLAGFTQLAERIDPEAVRALMARYFGLATAAIERHGGTVEKYIGDAVMAVFGLPALHEDDAIRAVRAAVDVRDAVTALNEELGQQHAVDLRVRIGVNTGEVVAGEASVRQQLVTGDAVNVAARLEQAAAPGEILLGSATWHLVRHSIRAEPVGPIEMHGKSDPVMGHRLIRMARGNEPESPLHDTPTVGREAELALLGRAFDAAATTRTCRLVTVVGAPGIGKSRLTREFVSSIRGHATVLRGRCLAYGDDITYWPIAVAVRSAAGIADEDDPGAAMAKLSAYVHGLPNAHRIANALAGAIGLGAVTAPREEIGWAVRMLLEGLAAQRPCVLVIDDVQWGAETLLDLLESVAVHSRAAPILLVCVARPELADARPAWATTVPTEVTLRVEPIPDSAAALLVAGLSDEIDLPPSAIQFVTAAADGNPLFLEELMQMLIEEGRLTRVGKTWHMNPAPGATQVPPTIQALLAARLDRLNPEDRALMQRGAVIGRVFQRAAIVELLPEAERARLDQGLRTLLVKELIKPEANREGDNAFRFRHLLIRDVAYESLPKRERADLHRRFAEWLLHSVGDRLPEVQEIVGYHFEQAFLYWRQLAFSNELSAQSGAAATEHLAAAAFRALDRSDLPAAVGLLRRSIAVAGPGDLLRAELAAELIDGLIQLGRIREARTELESMLNFPGLPADPPRRAWWELSQLSILYQTRAYEINEARPVFERAIVDFERSHNSNGLRRAWISRAQAHWSRLEGGLTINALERALGYSRKAARRSHELSILVWLTRAHCFGPTPVSTALAELARIRAAAETDPRIVAAVGLARSHLLAMVGETGDAAGELDTSIRMFEDLGMTIDVGRAGQAAYNQAVATGRPEEGRRRLDLANAQLEAIGEENFLSTNLALMACLLLDSGLPDEAERFARRAADIASPDDLASQWPGALAMAGVEAHRGDFDAAFKTIDTVLPLVVASDFHADAGDLLMRSADICFAAGDTARGRDLLDQSLQRFRLKGATAFEAIVERRMKTFAAGGPNPSSSSGQENTLTTHPNDSA
jgi:class 3 adenylate cyclase/tetratricopeptide (TPR) repeat protein